MIRAIPLGWSGLIRKCSSIFLGYSHWSLTGRRWLVFPTIVRLEYLQTFRKFGTGSRGDLLLRSHTLGTSNDALFQLAVLRDNPSNTPIPLITPYTPNTLITLITPNYP